ncbi:MAG: ComF family protein [Luteolibacter sp.]
MFEKAGKWLGHSVLDLVYPSACAVCETPLSEGRTICEGCAGEFRRVTKPFCQVCGEGFAGAIEGAFSCPNCRGQRFGFAFARPAFFRTEPLLELIHRLKYGREIHLAKGLGELACGAFADGRLERAKEEGWPLVPVPLHKRRLQGRHFNQAEEIAREMGRRLGIEVLPALRRVRDTRTQTLLSRAERLENLRHAFEISRVGKRWLSSENRPGVVLVDDVFTTGSTVNACAKVLKWAGVREVAVVTVMRG